MFKKAMILLLAVVIISQTIFPVGVASGFDEANEVDNASFTVSLANAWLHFLNDDGVEISDREKTFIPGETVRIQTNMIYFTHRIWELVPAIAFDTDDGGRSISFVMPESDVEIRNVSATHVYVENGSIEGESDILLPPGKLLPVGTEVTIVADDPQAGYRFSHWEVEWVSNVPGWGRPDRLPEFANPHASTTTFIVTSDTGSLMLPLSLRVRAVFEPTVTDILTYTVTVTDGEILVDNLPYGTIKDVSPGNIVTIRSTLSVRGQTGIRWEATPEVDFEIDNNSNTTFIMPESNIELRAVAIERMSVRINGGTFAEHPNSSRELFEMGIDVGIIANEPQAGYRFSHWELLSSTHVINLEFANYASPETTFAVPRLNSIVAQMTITAIFVPIEDQERFTVTVSNGFIIDGDRFPVSSKDFAPGDTVTVSRVPHIDNILVRWEFTPEIEYVNTEFGTITFTMPASDVEVNAVLVAFTNISVEGGMVNGVISDRFQAGTEVNLVANEPQQGYRFSHWEAEWRGLWIPRPNDLPEISNEPTTTFIVPVQLGSFMIPNPLFIRAVFIPISDDNTTTYSVTVTNAEILVDNSTYGTTKDVLPGDIVTIRSTLSIRGQTGIRWEATPEIDFEIDNNSNTIFIMPESNVELRAVAVERISVRISGGMFEDQPESPRELLEMGAEIGIIANEPQAGYRFSHWELLSSTHAINLEFANYASPETTFTVPRLNSVVAQMTITAVFIPVETQERFTVTVNVGYLDSEHNTFAPGEIVRLRRVAEIPLVGTPRFSHWETAPEVEFISADEFIMPESDVTIRGIMSNTVGVNIFAGTLVVIEGQRWDAIGVDALVEVTANIPQAGYRFSHWEASRWEWNQELGAIISVAFPLEFANSYSSTTTFVVPDLGVNAPHLNITAIFEPIPEEESNSTEILSLSTKNVNLSIQERLIQLKLRRIF